MTASKFLISIKRQFIRILENYDFFLLLVACETLILIKYIGIINQHLQFIVYFSNISSLALTTFNLTIQYNHMQNTLFMIP